MRAISFSLILIVAQSAVAVSRTFTASSRRPSAPATIQKGKISDPAEAARRLYNAWRHRNRKAALKVAEPKAVNKLFSVRRVPMKFKGCELHDEVFYCVYHNENLDLNMSIEVSGGASAGYHVRWVTFSSEH